MSLALTPALRAALAGWADHLRGIEDRAAATQTAYLADVTAFLDFLARHRGGLATPAALADLGPSDLRAFSAAERARGLSARSLARRLSAIKSFVRWCADREGIDATATLSARGPKYRRKLPRPLPKDAASSGTCACAVPVSVKATVRHSATSPFMPSLRRPAAQAR